MKNASIGRCAFLASAPEQIPLNALIATPTAETRQAVNSWPLDEGLIDYVDVFYGGATEENAFTVQNVIATPKFVLSGTEIDATTIPPDLLSGPLQEADGIASNVATVGASDLAHRSPRYCFDYKRPHPLENHLVALMFLDKKGSLR